jgi:endoglucanase
MGIAVGDPVAYYSPLVELTGGDRVCGKAIDDRIGCAILLELLKRLEGVSLAGTVHACVCVQEEIDFRGAKVAAYRLQPDYAVVVDTFMAGGTPDMDYHKELPAVIGEGPVLLLAHSGQIAHPAVNRYLRQAAERAGVSLQPCTIVGKAGTDTTTIHTAREGIPSSGLGLARRYSHTPVCVLDLNDAVDAVKLLEAFVLAMGEHRDLGFL